MRVECDSCGAKYSISDDKIIGRVFKVRCKKCSNMITVDGTALAGEEGEEATRIFDPSASGGGDAIWYVVIDGSQTGPLTPDEVAEQVRIGAIDAETFGWCEGMDDWIQLSEISALAGLVTPAAPAAPAAEAYEDESTRVVAADEYGVDGDFAFGKGFAHGSEPKAQPAAAPAPAPFSASVPRATGAEFFSAPASREVAVPGAAGGSATAASRAVGQRNESSVLFSLADLTSGSKPASKTVASEALPRTEGSGLIDIRVLAAGQGGTTAMPALGAAPGAAPGATTAMGAVPIAPLIPIPAKKSNTGLMVALGISGVVIVGLVAAIVAVLTRPPVPVPAPVVVQAPATPEVPAAPAEATGAAAPTEVAAAPTEGTAAAAEPAAPTEGSAAAEAAVAAAAAPTEAPVPTGTERPATRSEERERPATTTQVAAAPTPRAEPAPEPTPTRPTTERTREREGGDEAVASALSAIRGGRTAEPEQRPAPTPAPTPEAAPAPTGLSRSDVQATIRRYGSRVTSCGNAESAGQSFRVSFVIQPSGSVTNVSPAESDDVSTCIAGVVRDMTFPRFEGDPVPVTFPFRL